MKDFYLDIPGLDLEDMKAAKAAAEKDIKEDKKSSKQKKIKCKKE